MMLSSVSKGWSIGCYAIYGDEVIEGGGFPLVSSQPIVGRQIVQCRYTVA